MRGPTGSNVDDVLRAFETERNIQRGPGIAEIHSTIFTPNGSPPNPPRTGRDGVGTSADPLFGLGLGVHKDSDIQSVGSIGTTNTIERRGRRRAEPVGATLNLNV